MGTPIALATCRELPHGDDDDRELPGLLGAEFVVWDDPDVDWDRYDLVVVRSTWDYQERRDAFLAHLLLHREQGDKSPRVAVAA